MSATLNKTEFCNISDLNAIVDESATKVVKLKFLDNQLKFQAWKLILYGLTVIGSFILALLKIPQ